MQQLQAARCKEGPEAAAPYGAGLRLIRLVLLAPASQLVLRHALVLVQASLVVPDASGVGSCSHRTTPAPITIGSSPPLPCSSAGDQGPGCP